jgi:hypothetical protein
MRYHRRRWICVTRSWPGRWARRLHLATELGQAAFAMVTGIAILLLLTAGILFSTTSEHDPLVQGDLLQHLAYRGLEAGIDSYLTTINNNPNLINCNTSNTPGNPNLLSTATGNPTCSSALLPALDTWTQVPNTSGDGSSIPEFYMWTNPQFCFSTSLGTTGSPTCSAPSTGTAGATLAYVEEQVIGAAEIGPRYAYQSAEAEFTPENGFLSNLWWSNYEATDPQIASNPNTAAQDCTYDWNNNYYGPDKTNNGGTVPFPTSSYCNPVFFGPDDVLYGPVYSNDSIYVDGLPDFGVPAASGQAAVPSSVTTHDPSCLFVDPDKNEYKSGSGSGSCANASAQVGEYNSSTSTDDAPFEPIPSSDTELATLAAQDGCLYSGPTTITLYYNTAAGLPYMTVSSPDTNAAAVAAGNATSDPDNASTNSNNCGVGSVVGVPVPSGTKGNGVIFAENTPSSQQPCVTDANPFEDVLNGDSGGDAQTPGTQYYDVSGTSEDCEADVFVSNAAAASGTVPGMSGNLTIASQNNVIIDGNITYSTADCGSKFDSKYMNGTSSGECQYNSGIVPNDTLGLIAYHFVEVDHPVQTTTTCSQYFFGNCQRYTTTTSLEPACGTNGAPQAPNCDPNTGSGLTIDAAILALNDSFAVNNYTVGSPEGQLDVYGAIAQDWRGAVGQFNTQSDTVISGYSKYYLWDSRLEYVTVPYYLNPGTPSWALTSTGVLQGVGNPCATTANLPDPWPLTTGSQTCANTTPPQESV